jgi:hypothetical protein
MDSTGSEAHDPDKPPNPNKEPSKKPRRDGAPLHFIGHELDFSFYCRALGSVDNCYVKILPCVSLLLEMGLTYKSTSGGFNKRIDQLQNTTYEDDLEMHPEQDPNNLKENFKVRLKREFDHNKKFRELYQERQREFLKRKRRWRKPSNPSALPPEPLFDLNPLPPDYDPAESTAGFQESNENQDSSSIDFSFPEGGESIFGEFELGLNYARNIELDAAGRLMPFLLAQRTP